MTKLLVALAALNLWDATATLYWVAVGVATEANPILAAALDMGPAAFLAAKLALLAPCVLVLWQARRRRLARFGAALCVTAYAGVGVYHFVPWLY